MSTDERLAIHAFNAALPESSRIEARSGRLIIVSGAGQLWEADSLETLPEAIRGVWEDHMARELENQKRRILKRIGLAMREE